ncbi:MAG: 8-oxo-dGTP diphosphatase [Gaiellales bacterium]|nr:8-oxo-dGTP diphosphatase [Gaiellales bacterium]
MSHVTAELVAPVARRFGEPTAWDGSRELTDGNAATILRSTAKGRLHDVTFMIADGDEVVVIRKPSFPEGAWRVPSGGIALGESFAAGTLREAHEETGLEIELTGYPLVARSTFTYRGEPIPWTTHVITARAAVRELAPIDTGEIAGCVWMPVAELLGPVAEVLRASGSALFDYRADLHEEIARSLFTRVPGT